MTGDRGDIPSGITFMEDKGTYCKNFHGLLTVLPLLLLKATRYCWISPCPTPSQLLPHGNANGQYVEKSVLDQSLPQRSLAHNSSTLALNQNILNVIRFSRWWCSDCGLQGCDTMYLWNGYQYIHPQDYSATDLRTPKSELLDMYPLTVPFPDSAN